MDIWRGWRKHHAKVIEIKCLQKYLQYLQQKKEYDANKVNAIKSLKKKKNKLCFTRIEFF
jgi:hypothetical protein